MSDRTYNGMTADEVLHKSVMLTAHGDPINMPFMTECGKAIRDMYVHIKELEQSGQADNDRANKAERTLRRAGFTLVEGAQEWRRPIGPPASPLLDRIDQLTAELEEAREQLKSKSTAVKFFAYDDDCGFETFNTEAEAKKHAQDSIDSYRQEAAENWPEEVENVCWGVVLGTTKEVPVPNDGYDGSQGVADAGSCVDYVLTEHAAQQPAPDGEAVALQMLKQALFVGMERNCVHYLMANAYGRRDGALKAHNHDLLCRHIVAAVRGCDPDMVRHHHEDDYQAVHDGTQALTSYLDEVIGFPLHERPDYDDMVPKFFEKFFELAMVALDINRSASPLVNQLVDALEECIAALSSDPLSVVSMMTALDTANAALAAAGKEFTQHD